MRDLIREEADKYQEFFNFLNQEHDLIPTISEMNEIILEAQKVVKKLAIAPVSLDEQSEATVCDNPHCMNGTVEVIYGEPIRCSICDEQTGN